MCTALLPCWFQQVRSTGKLIRNNLTGLHLQVVNRMLTQLAKKKLDAVIAEAADAQFRLESDPATTVELANFLTFLDEIHERVRLTFHP